MKKRFLLMMLPIALISAACAPNAGALEPTTGSSEDTASSDAATRQPSSQDRLSAVQATTQALLPTRTAEPTRTAPAVNPAPLPAVSPGPGSTVNAPSPQPTATRVPTATPVRFDPNATPTPLWSSPPKLVPTATSTSVPPPLFVPPTIVAAQPEDQFVSLLNYQYTLPDGWKKIRTESALILTDTSGKTTVSITEQSIEPWRFPTALAIGAVSEPSRPADWDVWTQYSQRGIRGDQVYEFRFDGVKSNQNYMNIVQWFVWGDVQIQVSAEIPQFDWEFSPRAQIDLLSVLNSFEPHDDSRLFTPSEVLALLEARLDDRPSAIYARDEIARARYEMTCREIFTDLLNPPEYFGNGLWQMSALTLEGTEIWRVYEPSGSITSLDSNKSRC